MTRSPYPGRCRIAKRFGATLALAATVLASIGLAASPAAPVVATPSQPTTLDAADLGAFLDGRIPPALARGDLGAVSVVVANRDGVVLSRAWGYADVEAGVPMDPARHLVRPGSTSKLFTWIAVMQQVEAGRLDLDTDINTYLDFEIPADGFEAPITLRHLMTHRAGFEERIGELIVIDPEKAATNEAWLKAHVPARVFPPGKIAAYSNYGTALAGYIVERVSGTPFAEYVEAKILAPMDMTRSTFHQPVPAALAADVAAAYDRRSAGKEGFEWIVSSPAGALSATPDDMGRFVRALLDGRVPLEPGRLQEMWRYEARVHPALTPMALGFYRADRNGRRILAHGGDTRFFHSDLFVLPDEGVGMFLSISGTGPNGEGLKLRKDLVEGFLDRYFPTENRVAPSPPMNSAVDGASIEGSYLSSRGAFRNVLGFLGLLQPLKVVVDADGTLQTPSLPDASGQPMRWTPHARDVWLAADGQTRLAVNRNADGSLRSLGVSSVSAIVEWHPSALAGLFIPLLLAATVTLLVVVLAVPVRWLLARRYRITFPTTRARTFARWGALAGVLGVACLGIALAQVSTLAPADLWLRSAQALIGLCGLGAAAALIALRQRYVIARSLWRLALDALVAAAMAAIALLLGAAGFFSTQLAY